MQDKIRPIDPRIQRTRHLIRSAFFDLLETTEFEKITVNRITERATINRVTFYLHYRDIPDMLDKMADDLIRELYEAIGVDSPIDAALTVDAKSPSPLFIRMLEHIEHNAKIYKLLLATKRIPVFTERFQTVVFAMMANRIEQRIALSPQFGITPDIGKWFLSSAFIGTIINWLKNDLPYRPNYLAAQIVRLVPNFEP